AELALQADRRLIAVGEPDSRRCNLRNALAQSRNSQRLFIGGLRPAVPRIAGEVRTAVVGHLRVDLAAAIPLGPRRHLVGDIREVLPGPAANDGPVVERVGEAHSRSKSLLLARTS